MRPRNDSRAKPFASTRAEEDHAGIHGMAQGLSCHAKEPQYVARTVLMPGAGSFAASRANMPVYPPRIYGGAYQKAARQLSSRLGGGGGQ